MGEQRVPLPGLELVSGGLEEALIEPSAVPGWRTGRCERAAPACRRTPRGYGRRGLANRRQGVVDPDEVGPHGFPAAAESVLGS